MRAIWELRKNARTGYQGNFGFELLYLYSLSLFVVGSLLSSTEFISWTERRRNVSSTMHTCRIALVRMLQNS